MTFPYTFPFSLGIATPTGVASTTCVYDKHFKLTAGLLRPQAWAQYRQVATAITTSKSGTFPVSGGGAKDVLLQGLTCVWTNNTPIQQLVYGLVTRGGCRITLTAKSRGYFLLSMAAQAASTAGALNEESRFGVGGDAGRAGLFASDAYAIVELRQNAVTMPLKPGSAGFGRVNPGVTYRAEIELRFVSEVWQSGNIDGGNTQTDSSYITGDTRIDLFAIPALT